MQVDAHCEHANPTCMYEALDGYRADSASKQIFNTGCSGTVLRRDYFYNSNTAFWKRCMDSVMGSQLQGIVGIHAFVCSG